MTTFDPKTLQPKQLEQLQLKRQMGVLRYSPDGKMLAAGGLDGLVHRWDATGAKLVGLPTLQGHNGWVQALAFAPDSKRLFTGDSWGRLRCWAAQDKDSKPVWDLPTAHATWLRQLAISPDGKSVASCASDGTVRLWSADQGKPLAEFAHPQDVLAVNFHPDGKSLVTGDLLGTVRQWDLASGKTARTFEAQELHHTDRMQSVGGVRCLAFDRDGKTLAVGGGKPTTGGFVQGTATIVLIDWANGKTTTTMKVSGTTEVYAHDVHFHPAGFVMAVSSGQPGNGRLYFQKPGEAAPFFVSKGIMNCHSLAVHPQLTRLAVVSTNAGSSGNGRLKGKDGEYPGNYSPLSVLELPKIG